MYKHNKYNHMNDYLFKYIFGREERKRITLSFINAVLDLEGDQEMQSITFIDREIDPDIGDGKKSSLDVYGVTNDGSKVNIEVQVIDFKNMNLRTLYYWAGMFHSLKKGEPYSELCKSISIAVLGFSFLDEKSFHNHYRILNVDSYKQLTDKLDIHFLELPKFESKSIKEMNRLERWGAYFSNKLDPEEMEELAMSDTAIKEALQAEVVFMQDDIERWKYEQREKAIRDYESGISAYAQEGEARGLAKGREEGRQEGLKGQIDLLRYMLNSGTSIEQMETIPSILPEALKVIKEELGGAGLTPKRENVFARNQAVGICPDQKEPNK